MQTLARRLTATVRPAAPEDSDFIIRMRHEWFARTGDRYYPALPELRWWIAEFDGEKVGCMGLLLLPGANEVLGMELYRAPSAAGLAGLRAMREEAFKLCEYLESDLSMQVPVANAKMCRALEKAGFEARAIVYRRARKRNV